MYSIIAAVAGSVADQVNMDDLMNARPGGIIRYTGPHTPQVITYQPPQTDCQGCGAPLIRYQYACDYCKRPA